MFFSERVYISPGKDFVHIWGNADFTKLLDLVAKNVRIYNGILLYDESNSSQVFRGRTKWVIIELANAFLAKFDETLDVVDEKPVVSLKQINHLIRALEQKQGRITCHALVLLHIIFVLLSRHAVVQITDAEVMQIQYLARVIYDVVEAYALEYPEDVLANFLLRCHPALIAELQCGVPTDNPNAFPAIPRRHPDENN